MDIILGLLAILAVIGLAMLMSNNRGKIPFKGIIIMILLQLFVTWFMFQTEIGQDIIKGIAAVFNKLIEFGTNGVNFVVGGIAIEEGASVFFFDVLLIIVFFATILSVLTYLKVLPLLIKYLGGALSFLTGLPKIESFTAVNSMFFGQSEALIAVQSQFHRITENRLYIVSASAMGSVSASIIGAYMQMLPDEYVLVAIPLNMFSALIVASIIAPPVVEDKDDDVDIDDVSGAKSIFEAMANGALDGGKIALIVATMLIAFLASLELVNYIVGVVIPVEGASLEAGLGYLLLPLTFLMGINPGELVDAGSIMGLKIVTNEFVAMLELVDMQDQFSEKTMGIVSVFLTSFANFGSIGIIAGTVAGIDSEKGKTVSRFGLKLLTGATLASILSATIAGLFL
ncbi:NupC/NupG family nucleoside CNT transporter [Alkalibacillus almallahensis]|uniref:NupC/NupG family nucleoside CNT transporter n=1 Tax=Alkalibacillus almallahensis TaxID=1379154 RepID=UPI00141DE581|nr:nucleoside transporter C-terminal domain-containing protein [Alkalibacillus almallahensis]NIK13092.1 CNT family concentrative nucleoside transporter/nucleoside transport protein [Alkalibacillus almallahensis]